jgi:hypothetical protein
MSRWKSIAVAGSAALALLACGGPGGVRSSTHPDPAAPTDTRAADLRVRLDALLGEHVLLAAKATGASVSGRAEEAGAYQALLGRNSSDLGDVVGAALGPEFRNRFVQAWSAHDGFLARYAGAVASQDRGQQDQAAQALTGEYVPQFASIVGSAMGLPAESVAELARQHVVGMEQVVHDLVTRDWPSAYAAERRAYTHMRSIGDMLAAAIVRKQPARLPGDATARSVDLRVTLDQLLQEHAYLTTAATSAALGDRTDELQAAARSLNDGAADLARALGAVAGTGAQARFDQLWTTHDALVIDYALGVARGDLTTREGTLADLANGSTVQFASFLADLTGLPPQTLSAMLRQHVLATTNAVDAQGTRDAADAAEKDREAAQQAAAIGDPVTAALVRRLPSRFR